jgi:hypothetical protein
MPNHFVSGLSPYIDETAGHGAAPESRNVLAISMFAGGRPSVYFAHRRRDCFFLRFDRFSSHLLAIDILCSSFSVMYHVIVSTVVY